MNCLSRLALAALLTAPLVPAQCPYTSATTRTIGQGCNHASTGFCRLASRPTLLEVNLDARNCQLDLNVVAFSGCGASVPLRAVVIGFRQVNFPIPSFGQSCTLHVVPALVLASTTESIELRLPRRGGPLTLLMQAYALSIPPFGNQISTLSDAHAVNLQ